MRARLCGDHRLRSVCDDQASTQPADYRRDSAMSLLGDTQWAAAAQAWAAGTGPGELPGVCPLECGDPKPPREGRSLNIRSWGDQLPCRDRTMVSLVGPGIAIAPPLVYRGCVHSEHNAMRVRVAADQLWFDPAVTAMWRQVHTAMRGPLAAHYWRPLLDEVGGTLEPTNFETWLSHYQGPQRRMMKEARTEVTSAGLADRQAMMVKAFVKVELLPKLLSVQMAKEPKARLIQGRHPRLTAGVGPSFHALGKALCRVWDVRNPEPLPVVYASSCDALEIGSWYGRCLDEGLRPWPDDADKWDASQGPGPLTSWAEDLMDLRPRFAVRRLLQDRLGGEARPRHGVTKHGTKYTLAWQVCSGDGDTSCGNSASNGKMRIHRAYNSPAPWARSVRVAVNGDNALSMIPLAVGPAAVAEERAAYRAYGIVINSEGGLGHIYDGQICSGRIWAIGANRWKYGPKIGRVLSKTFWWLNPQGGPFARRAWLRSVAESLRDSCFHIPLLRVIVQRILRETEDIGALPLPASSKDEPWRIWTTTRDPPSFETYEQMAYLYGGDPSDYRLLEEWLEHVPIWGHRLSHPLLDEIVRADLA